jgi:hypothetical protein
MRTIESHPLTIHPELQPCHERGPFEVPGLPEGSMREWFVYDRYGVVRIKKAVADRDVDEGFVDRLRGELDEMEARDEEQEA